MSLSLHAQSEDELNGITEAKQRIKNLKTQIQAFEDVLMEKRTLLRSEEDSLLIKQQCLKLKEKPVAKNRSVTPIDVSSSSEEDEQPVLKQKKLPRSRTKRRIQESPEESVMDSGEDKQIDDGLSNHGAEEYMDCEDDISYTTSCHEERKTQKRLIAPVRVSPMPPLPPSRVAIPSAANRSLLAISPAPSSSSAPSAAAAESHGRLDAKQNARKNAEYDVGDLVEVEYTTGEDGLEHIEFAEVVSTEPLPVTTRNGREVFRQMKIQWVYDYKALADELGEDCLAEMDFMEGDMAFSNHDQHINVYNVCISKRCLTIGAILSVLFSSVRCC